MGKKSACHTKETEKYNRNGKPADRSGETPYVGPVETTMLRPQNSTMKHIKQIN